jgi:eukaryotic-like serine/threonine-protein kinase
MRGVALKVIKLGMATKQVVARFEAERLALAMMDHPNIAKVLDSGTTEVGRRYLVMELVRGIKITDYCDQANLTTKERLDLFIKVCQAIQHAHQKGRLSNSVRGPNFTSSTAWRARRPADGWSGVLRSGSRRREDRTGRTRAPCHR